MSRSDWLAVALTSLAAGVALLVSGPAWGWLFVFLGFVALVVWYRSVDGLGDDDVQPYDPVVISQLSTALEELRTTVAETAQKANTDNRPWLFIQDTKFDPKTGKIDLLIRNRGNRHAFQVEVENWVEISKELRSRMIPKEELADFEERWRTHKLFETEFDSRKQTIPGVGPSRGVCVQFGMVLAGQHFRHVIHTEGHAELLMKELKISGPRNARFRGQIRYTDAEGKLKPDYPICFEVHKFRIDNELIRALAPCPDIDMNTSR